MVHDPTHLFEGQASPGTTRFAKIVSFIFQAPFISIPVFIALNMQASDTAMFAISTVICLLTATVIPVVTVQYFSVKFNNDDGDIVRREDRFLPLVCGTASYLLGYVLMLLVGAPAVSTTLMLCYVLCTGLIILISRYWKISIHSTGLMGPTIALAYAYGPVFLLILMFLPIIAYGRYVLRKHTPAQLVGGACFGTVVTLLTFAIVL